MQKVEIPNPILVEITFTPEKSIIATLPEYHGALTEVTDEKLFIPNLKDMLETYFRV